jgi:hypothetical protein
VKLKHAIVAAPALAFAIYRLLLRKRSLAWGATEREARAALPGDELLCAADVVSTRAITIDTLPEHIWPWLVQMGGHGRGGAYTYDWIENLLGMDMHSVDHVIADLQRPEVGDEIFGSPAQSMRIEILEPQRALVVRSSDGNWVWSFVLDPVDDTHTRLISRNRFTAAGQPLPARIAWSTVVDPGSLIMERKMLRGIKRRAERLAAERSAAAV